MPITKIQRKLIEDIDRRMTKLRFNNGSNEDLLELVDTFLQNEKVNRMLNSIDQDELDILCDQYPGFYVIIKTLDQLALYESKGIIPEITDEFLADLKDSLYEEEALQNDPNGAITRELKRAVTSSTIELHKILSSDLVKKDNFLAVINTFLISIIDNSANLADTIFSGSSPAIYAQLESLTKAGGYDAMENQQFEKWATDYSAANIESDDATTAMNYVGQELSNTLFKVINELPVELRSLEMPLRGTEAFLANLLDQKFNHHDPHKVLNNFCDHVHLALNDLKKRKNDEAKQRRADIKRVK